MALSGQVSGNHREPLILRQIGKGGPDSMNSKGERDKKPRRIYCATLESHATLKEPD